VALVKW